MTQLESLQANDSTRLESFFKRLDSTRIKARKTRVPKTENIFFCEKNIGNADFNGVGKYILTVQVTYVATACHSQIAVYFSPYNKVTNLQCVVDAHLAVGSM